MVLRDEDEGQGSLFSERQLLEPRSLFTWERLCKRPKELRRNQQARHWEPERGSKLVEEDVFL